jgi:hypothetical protein
MLHDNHLALCTNANTNNTAAHTRIHHRTALRLEQRGRRLGRGAQRCGECILLATGLLTTRRHLRRRFQSAGRRAVHSLLLPLFVPQHVIHLHLVLGPRAVHGPILFVTHVAGKQGIVRVSRDAGCVVRPLLCGHCGLLRGVASHYSSLHLAFSGVPVLRHSLGSRNDTDALHAVQTRVTDLDLERQLRQSSEQAGRTLVRRARAVLKRKLRLLRHVPNVFKQLVARDTILVPERHPRVEQQRNGHVRRQNFLGQNGGKILGDVGGVHLGDVTTRGFRQRTQRFQIAAVTFDAQHVNGDTFGGRELTDTAVKRFSSGFCGGGTLLKRRCGRRRVVIHRAQANVRQPICAQDDLQSRWLRE